MFIEIMDHVEEGLARLIYQYSNATNLQSLLTSFILQVQVIENVLTDMNNLRYLGQASGQQLDNIGEIVGIPRPIGTSDAAYFLEILGQIKINISQGQPEQIIQVFLLFTGVTQVRLFEEFPAEVLVESTYNPPDQTTLNNLLDVLGQTSPAGVRINGLVVYDATSPFAYRVNVAPGAGYGTVSDPTVGGKYGTLRRAVYPFGYGVSNPNIMGYGTKLDPLVGGAYQG
jgi:hypothetical protein